jgi:hypothetical protein
MWKFVRALATENPSRRSGKSEPGPVASLARAYDALDLVAWLAARRRLHPSELETR